MIFFKSTIKHITFLYNLNIKQTKIRSVSIWTYIFKKFHINLKLIKESKMIKYGFN